MDSESMSTGQLLKEANQLKRAGKLDEAIAIYRQAIALNPDFSWFYYDLGDVLTKKGCLEEAIVEYRHAVNLNPESILFKKTLRKYSDLLTKNNDSLKGAGQNNINDYANDLQNFFENNEGRVIHKWMHYFDIYDKHFKKFRNKEVHFLEIGVSHGGSLQMWKNYFGEKAAIYGIDIDSRCKEVEENQIKVFIGDQASREFWKQFKEAVPRLDIILDDGGHQMAQQINSFEEMFDYISVDGVYMIEDICTSYWHEYGGGYKKPSSFIEYSKDLIDVLNAWYSQDESILEVSKLTRQIHSVNYYSNAVVIEKRSIEKPYHQKTGSLLL